MSGRFDGRVAVVLGAGVAGASAARVLAAEGARVRVSDADPSAGAELRAEGIDVLAEGQSPEHLDGADLVVASPGIPPSAEVIRWARERGLPVWGELELGSQLATAPYLAVTGTNGKTTTTEMIASCLRASGLDAIACGNIGRPFPATARETHDVLVVEASSFQLAFQDSFHPRVSVLLNLAPDHLDWHGSFDAYAEAKAKIFLSQRGDDTHVGNRDDSAAAALSRTAGCRLAWFSLGTSGDPAVTGWDAAGIVAADWGSVAVLDEAAPTRGARADAAACAAACRAFGASPADVEEGLRTFRPAHHRGDEIGRVAGVRFIDDSKATNVHAALAAIEDVDDAVLIAGGRAKGVDLSELARGAPHLRAVVAIGEAAPEVVRAFERMLPVQRASSIEAAVAAAFELASPDGTVLLAPACASWDQFRDYAERGDRFAAAARALEEVRAHG